MEVISLRTITMRSSIRIIYGPKCIGFCDVVRKYVVLYHLYLDDDVVLLPMLLAFPLPQRK